jgi:hypothetical protein
MRQGGIRVCADAAFMCSMVVSEVRTVHWNRCMRDSSLYRTYSEQYGLKSRVCKSAGHHKLFCIALSLHGSLNADTRMSIVLTMDSADGTQPLIVTEASPSSPGGPHHENHYS